jgi:pimeloyl-ACP methyl ester carboxylesterase
VVERDTASPELVVHFFGVPDPAARTLVLLHGITDSGSSWGDAVTRWRGTYRIAALDAPGHGQSPRFTAAQLADEPAEQMYAATIAAIERIGAGSGPAILVGHSMGGAMAAAVTARRPDLVAAVVLEDPAWLPPLDSPADAALPARWAADRRRFIEDPAGTLAAERQAHPGWPEIELEPWAEAKRETDPAFLALGRDVLAMRDPWTELAARLRRPTLVVTGTDETIVPRSSAIIKAIANPAIEVVVVDGAGHCVRRDRGDAFHAVVDRWIADRFAESHNA